MVVVGGNVVVVDVVVVVVDVVGVVVVVDVVVVVGIEVSTVFIVCSFCRDRLETLTTSLWFSSGETESKFSDVISRKSVVTNIDVAMTVPAFFTRNFLSSIFIHSYIFCTILLCSASQMQVERTIHM